MYIKAKGKNRSALGIVGAYFLILTVLIFLTPQYSQAQLLIHSGGGKSEQQEVSQEVPGLFSKLSSTMVRGAKRVRNALSSIFPSLSVRVSIYGEGVENDESGWRSVPSFSVENMEHSDSEYILASASFPNASSRGRVLGITNIGDVTENLINLGGGAIEKPETPTQNIVVNSIIERVVSGVTQQDIANQVGAANAALSAEINNVRDLALRRTASNFGAVALTQRIDQLTSVKLHSAEVIGGISGISDADIPDSITASNYFPLTGGVLNGALSFPYFTATSTSATSSISTGGFTVGTNQFLVQQTSGNVGIGTTSPWAKLSVAGIGSFDDYVRTSFIISTSTTATSTFAGGLTVDTSAFVVDPDAGRVGIGTTSPWANLSVDHQAGEVALAIGSSTATSFVVNENGYVGIGTSSPTNRLIVFGTDGSADGQVLIYGSGATGGSIGIGGDNGRSIQVSGNGQSPYFDFSSELTEDFDFRFAEQDTLNIFTITSSSTADIFNIHSAGRVGIGTTSPWANLSVDHQAGEVAFAIGSSSATSFVVNENGYVGIGTSSPTNRLIVFGNDGGEDGQVLIYGSGATGGSIGIGGDNGRSIQVSGNGQSPYFDFSSELTEDFDFRFAEQDTLNIFTITSSSTADIFNIHSAGRVGIGTTSPYSKLSVNPESGEIGFVVGSSTATNFIVDDQARVGIGTSTVAGSVLHVDGPTSRASLRLSNDFGSAYASPYSDGVYFGSFAQGGDTAIFASSTEVFRATAGGKVGIGTTTPVSTLSIQGSLCVRDTGSCGTTAGTIYATTAAISDIDLAENFPTKDASIEAGEIVAIDSENPEHVRRASSNGDVIVGIISTAPGLLLGKDFENSKAVALAGRVPVKVNLEGGEISVGDRIALSSVSGIGKKADDDELSVGLALDSFKGEAEKDGKIVVFVNLNAGYKTQIASAIAATDASIDAEISDSLTSLLNQLREIGIGITRGVVQAREFIADKLTVRKVVTDFLEMKDATTGDTWCVRIDNGEWDRFKGTCGDTAASVEASEADDFGTVPDPVVEEEPLVEDEVVPESEVVTEEETPAEETAMEEVLEEGPVEEAAVLEIETPVEEPVDEEPVVAEVTEEDTVEPEVVAEETLVDEPVADPAASEETPSEEESQPEAEATEEEAPA